jgi:poly(rC)-binding protein 2/3/4
LQVTGSFQSIQDALLQITGRIRDVIIPPKPHPSGGMPPYPPAGNTSHQPAPPHHSGGMPPYPMHPFRPHPPMGPFDMVDHRPPGPPGPPPSHQMEHMGAGPYSYGGEQGGPRPYVEQPSQRTWGPEVSILQMLFDIKHKFFSMLWVAYYAQMALLRTSTVR